MPQKIFTATTGQWSPDLNQDLERCKEWHQWDWDDLEVRSSDLMGYLWKCKQLEIEEMAVCLSVGPGQGGSWIKAFQQIVSIISLLLLPLPTFFTIPAQPGFCSGSVYIWWLLPRWPFSTSLGDLILLQLNLKRAAYVAFVARGIWNVRDKQGVLRSPRTGGE